MTSLRRLARNHRLVCAWGIALALLMKVIVPAGFMPVVSGGGVAIEICTGLGVRTMVMPAPGVDIADAAARPASDAHGSTDHGPDHGPDHGKPMPCAFAGLSAPALAAADPLVLAIALAFALATAFRGAALRRVAIPAFLRPPLRGPPRRQ